MSNDSEIIKKKKLVEGQLVQPEQEQLIERLDQIAWLMDECFELPGNVRIGLDGILGLVPVVGDLISAGISLWIIRNASALGLPFSIRLRMLSHTMLDVVVGSVPFIGDVFDVGWKANRRNIDLLIRYLEAPEATLRESNYSLAIVIGSLILIFCVSVFAIARLAAWLSG